MNGVLSKHLKEAAADSVLIIPFAAYSSSLAAGSLFEDASLVLAASTPLIAATTVIYTIRMGRVCFPSLMEGEPLNKEKHAERKSRFIVNSLCGAFLGAAVTFGCANYHQQHTASYSAPTNEHSLR